MKLSKLLSVVIVASYLPICYAGNYTLLAQRGVKATVFMTGSSSPLVAPNAYGSEVKFQTNLYSEGMVIAEMSSNKNTIKNTCHFTTLEDDKWAAGEFPGDNCGILAKDGKGIIKVGKPVVVHNKVSSSMFSPLEDEKISLVDYNKSTRNLLFRGTNPLTPGQNQRLDHQGLLHAFKDRFKQVPKEKFPDKIVIVDISVLNNYSYSEGPALYLEKQGFERNNNHSAEDIMPDHFYPPLTQIAYKFDNNNPNVTGRFFSSTVQPIPYKKFPYDGDVSKLQEVMQSTTDKMKYHGKIIRSAELPLLVEQIVQMMNTKYDIPHIFYVHCQLGRDRTSEVIVPYLMLQYRMSLAEAYVRGTTISSSESHKQRFVTLAVLTNFPNTLRWYCLYLKQNTRYKDIEDCNVQLDNKKIFFTDPWDKKY